MGDIRGLGACGPPGGPPRPGGGLSPGAEGAPGKGGKPGGAEGGEVLLFIAELISA